MKVKKNVLSPAQRRVIQHALMIAAETFDEHATTMKKIVKQLRAGSKSHAMFAKGEDGARAADAIARGHEGQAQDARELRGLLEEAGEIWLTSEEE